MREHWTLHPDVVFLNHGSFGACPKRVLAHQSALRERLEREPIQFFLRDLPALVDEARTAVADFVGARPDDVTFVRNATTGVNGVVRSLRFEPGDELLTTNHTYNACKNVLEFVAARTGARVVIAAIPFPLQHPDEAFEPIVAAVTDRTRLALIDHVTSPTGLVFPITRIVRALRERGVETLVDGAHAPGMLDLDLEAIGAAYYASNFHKWTCAPKGVGLLHVRRDMQNDLHPSAISHGYNSPRNRSRFLEEADWIGTDDPTPMLCVPHAIREVGALLEGGWPAIRARNRQTVLEGRAILERSLSLAPSAPESMIGSLATVPLPDGTSTAPRPALTPDPLQSALYDRHRIEVPIPSWPAPPKRFVRISAHLYNDLDQYRTLAAALRQELSAP